MRTRITPNRLQCGECLGSVAHCLCQPLTALRGLLELALRSKLNEQDFRAALEAPFALTDLIVNLLISLRDLSEAARADAPPVLVSLRDLVKETLEEVRGLADSRGVKITVVKSLDATVLAPPDLLRELIAKLLLLSIQRSPNHCGVWLSVSTDGNSACLFLADCGPAPPCEIDSASLETATLGGLFSKAAKGHSLGWTIVRVLAEALGGTLDVSPRKPQGCCYLLRLPSAARHA